MLVAYLLDCLRLGFLYSATNGGNGSVRFSEELSRPGYEGLAEVVEQYVKVKEAIDAVAKEPISWWELTLLHTCLVQLSSLC